MNAPSGNSEPAALIDIIIGYLPLALLMAGIFSGSQAFIALLMVAFVIAAILWVMSRTISFLEDIASLFR
ncbi:MAG: hypothetical protein OXC05_10180 [Halieaceae bacterium]|nr:hypothetical protein [Halieaceae bacterium]